MANGSTAGPWIIRPRPRQRVSLRLFCLPWAGGAASGYTGWADALPDVVEMCALQLPGRENRLRETPHRRLEPLVADIYTAIAPLLDAPCAFFGHSMGALLAFELARLLRDDGRSEPQHIFVAGCGAPQLRRLRHPLHRLPDDALIGALQRLDGFPDWVASEPELLELVLPTLRADLELCETYGYRHAAPLSCTITALGGTEDRAVLPLELAAWERQTTAPFQLRLFSGSHFFVAPHRDAILDIVSSALLDANA